MLENPLEMCINPKQHTREPFAQRNVESNLNEQKQSTFMQNDWQWHDPKCPANRAVRQQLPHPPEINGAHNDGLPEKTEQEQ